MPVPVAVIAVVSIIGTALLLAGIVAVVMVTRQKQRTQNAKDIEGGEAPTRKVRVKHGRVVSTAESIFSAAGRKFSSQRNSTMTVLTVDLENDIKAFRKDYPPLPRDKDGQLVGIPQKALHTIAEKEMDQQSPYMSETATSPSSMGVAESSWKTFNGHRRLDDILSSPRDSMPKRDFGSRLSFFGPSSPRSTSGESMQPMNMSTKAPSLADEQTQPLSPTALGTLPSLAIYRANPDLLNNDSKKSGATRKPAPLDTKRASGLKTGYVSPSPTLSSTSQDPTTPKDFLSTSQGNKHVEVSPPSFSPFHGSVYISDVDSQPSRPQSQKSQKNSLGSKIRKMKPNSSKTGDKKKHRPPPIITGKEATVTAPKSSEQSMHSAGPSTTGFLSSPALSTAPSLPSPSALPRLAELAKRKSARLSVRTFNSGELSPFAVAPVQRVPLFAGKASQGREVKMPAAQLNKSSPLSGESPRTERTMREALEARKARKGTSPLANESAPTNIAAMLKQAHDAAQSLEPMTPNTPMSGKRTTGVVPQVMSPPVEMDAGQVGSKKRPAYNQRSTSYDPSNSPPKAPAAVARDATRKSTATHLRPGLLNSQARSLSGNIMLSQSQTAAHEDRVNTSTNGTPRAATSAAAYELSGRGSRRSRYDIAAGNITTQTAFKTNTPTTLAGITGSIPSAPATAGIYPSRTSNDSNHSGSGTKGSFESTRMNGGFVSGPSRKGSLPSRLSDAPGCPPDPKVLSKLLGLVPASPIAGPDYTSSPVSLNMDLPIEGAKIGGGPVELEGATTEGSGSQKRWSAKKQVLGGGGMTKETEVTRVTQDLSLMSAGLEKGMRRGAVSVKEH